MQTAAEAYRIDPLILYKLDDLGMRVECHQVEGPSQVPLTAVEQHWLNNVFPELVRQIARVESGIAVDVYPYAFSSGTPSIAEAIQPAVGSPPAPAISKLATLFGITDFLLMGLQELSAIAFV